MQQYKRRIIMVKGPLQVRFALIGLFLSLMVTIVIGVYIYVNINTTMVNAYNLEPEFVKSLRFVTDIIFVILLIYSAIVFSLTIFISHKIAGPLFRFEKSCDEIINGNLDFRIKLRKNDSLMDLQKKFNLMLDSLQEKIKKIDNLCTSHPKTPKSEEIHSEINKQFKI